MNVSISEILLILVIALLVIKPEQLPDLAFKLGRMNKLLRNVFAKLKSEANGLIDSADEYEQKRGQR